MYISGRMIRMESPLAISDVQLGRGLRRCYWMTTGVLGVQAQDF